MIQDLLQESYNAMRHNRRRTALTMLGMAWGIATVVMLLAYGDGFGRACANIFANFGTNDGDASALDLVLGVVQTSLAEG